MIPVFRDVAIIGGGCFGTFYAGQLAEARDRGKVEYRRVLVVDHDPACRAANELPPRLDRELVVTEWDAFLDHFLDQPAEPDDAIVPSPLMPHLMGAWLERRAQARWPGRAVERRPLPAEVGTPYESTGPDGTRYLSFADWICPVHCIEPLTCPVIRGPRTWELADTLQAFSQEAGLDGAVSFLCRHQVFGVGMFMAAEARAGLRLVERAGETGHEARVAVGTVSRCHGAVVALHLGIFPPMGATT
ncbi:MAG TPA: hypothetical protein VMK53_07310 [Gemmatimonadales bacterium]|nr:hypothetical protein [Gemmatimonadales bacterium]